MVHLASLESVTGDTDDRVRPVELWPLLMKNIYSVCLWLDGRDQSQPRLHWLRPNRNVYTTCYGTFSFKCCVKQFVKLPPAMSLRDCFYKYVSRKGRGGGWCTQALARQCQYHPIVHSARDSWTGITTVGHCPPVWERAAWDWGWTMYRAWLQAKWLVHA